MNWLLWREYRLNRWILALGTVGILAPLLIAAVAFSTSDGEAFPKFLSMHGCSQLSAAFAVALLAGNAVAGGRADRSAEFLAYLPLSRWRTLASKLIFPLLIIAVAWSLNLVFVVARIRPVEPMEFEGMTDLRVFASALLITYSAAWLATQFLSSPTYAGIIGFVAPWVVAVLVVAMPTLSLEDMTTLNGWVVLVNLSVALVCFCIGTGCYLRTQGSTT
jgi:ABC-type transport system involved in multi-copper enzyme maturation permease subunit